MDVSLISINLIEAGAELLGASYSADRKENTMPDTHEASFTIEHEDSDTKGRYRVELKGAEAEMTYSKAVEAMIIPRCLMPCVARRWALRWWQKRSKTFAPQARKSCRFAHLRKHSLHVTQSGVMCFPDQPAMLFHLLLLEKTHELDA